MDYRCASLNLDQPSASFRIQVGSFVASGIFAVKLVEAILLLRAGSQILNPIVVAVAVNVVNRTFGPFVVLHEPRNAVGLHVLAVERDVAMTPAVVVVGALVSPCKNSSRLVVNKRHCVALNSTLYKPSLFRADKNVVDGALA